MQAIDQLVSQSKTTLARQDPKHAAGNKTVASECRLNSYGKSKQRKAGLRESNTAARDKRTDA